MIIFSSIETERKAAGNAEAIIQLPALQSSLVILGYGAFIPNLIFAVLCLVYWLLKKQHTIARWLVWVNLLFLVLQFFYFKLY